MAGWCYFHARMFSKACMYAIRAVVVIASANEQGTYIPLTKISALTGAPSAFMAKVLQQLVHAGIITSVKGHGGGFGLDPEREEPVKLVDVVKAIDGDALFSGCALGFPKCDGRRPCPVHDQVTRVRAELDRVLANVLIEKLGDELAQGSTFLRGKLK